MQLYGSKKRVPMCGFGFGDCVIIELLKGERPVCDMPNLVFALSVGIGSPYEIGGQESKKECCASIHYF